MRKLFSIVALVWTASIGYSQPLATVIKTQAIEMGRALIKNDAEGFQKYMHPKVIEKAGGPEKMRAMMDSGFVKFKKFNGQVTKITYGNPAKIISFKKEFQTTLPQTTELSTTFATIIFESTLIAISRDKGKNWYFIDTNTYHVEELKNDLPDLSPELIIPPPSKPKFIAKEPQ